MSYGNNFVNSIQESKVKTNANADFYNNSNINDEMVNEAEETNDKNFTLAEPEENLGTSSSVNLEKFYETKQKIIGEEIDKFIKKKKEQFASNIQAKYEKYSKYRKQVKDKIVNDNSDTSKRSNTPKSNTPKNNSIINKNNVISYDDYKSGTVNNASKSKVQRDRSLNNSSLNNSMISKKSINDKENLNKEASHIKKEPSLTNIAIKINKDNSITVTTPSHESPKSKRNIISNTKEIKNNKTNKQSQFRDISSRSNSNSPIAKNENLTIDRSNISNTNKNLAIDSQKLDTISKIISNPNNDNNTNDNDNENIVNKQEYRNNLTQGNKENKEVSYADKVLNIVSAKKFTAKTTKNVISNTNVNSFRKNNLNSNNRELKNIYSSKEKQNFGKTIKSSNKDVSIKVDRNIHPNINIIYSKSGSIEKKKKKNIEMIDYSLKPLLSSIKRESQKTSNKFIIKEDCSNFLTTKIFGRESHNSKRNSPDKNVSPNKRYNEVDKNSNELNLNDGN